jgi:hypothetical protein
VRAEDEKGNIAKIVDNKSGIVNIQNAAGARMQVIVDNFAPYVSEVKIKHQDKMIYHAKWDKVDKSSRKLNRIVDKPVEKNGTLYFELIFSETMDTSTVQVSFFNPDGATFQPPIYERFINQNIQWDSTYFKNDT